MFSMDISKSAAFLTLILTLIGSCASHTELPAPTKEEVETWFFRILDEPQKIALAFVEDHGLSPANYTTRGTFRGDPSTGGRSITKVYPKSVDSEVAAGNETVTTNRRNTSQSELQAYSVLAGLLVDAWRLALRIKFPQNSRSDSSY